MRLNDLDQAQWLAIAKEIDTLLDEIADRTPDDEDWPDDCVQRRVYERLNDASLDALFCAGGGARLRPGEMRAFFDAR